MNQQPAFCTIITQNYLPYARVLMASVRQHCPDSQRHVLLADADTPTREEADFALHGWKTLGLQGYRVRAFVNAPGALCAMLKPTFIAWLLRHTHAPLAIYADADSRFYHPPTALLDAAAKASFLLTPHIVRPGLTPDSLRNEGAIARSGTYNTGLFAVRKDADGLGISDWWANCMWREMWQDQTFAWEQSWAPLIRQLYPAVWTFDDEAYNVAYWNLSQRTLSADESGRPMVRGAGPLRHFHFSFFDPRRPNLLVSHYDEEVAPPDAVTGQLLAEYAAALQAADADRASQLPYGFSRFRDGHPITQFHREFFRRHILPFRDEDGDPFDSSYVCGPWRGIRSLRRAYTLPARIERRLRGMLVRFRPKS